MNKKVQHVVNILGWILFTIIYSGLIILLLWYIFDVKKGLGIWNTLSIFAQIGLVLLGAGALVLYTILMFFIQMGLEALWIKLLKRLLNLRHDLDKARNAVDSGIFLDELEKGKKNVVPSS